MWVLNQVLKHLDLVLLQYNGLTNLCLTHILLSCLKYCLSCIVFSCLVLRFRAICTSFLLVDGVCCNEHAMWFVSLLRSVHVEASPTNTVGVCSSPFLYEVLLIISSPCLDWVLKNIADCQTIFPTSLGRGRFQGIFRIYDLQVL